MIAKAKSIQHGAQGIDYALNKDQAQVIDKRHVIGNNGQEIKQEFKLFQNLNNRTKNNDLSFVISPEPKDGKSLTNSDFRDISTDFLKKLGLEKHQAIVIKHQDKKHTHLHLFVNRIDSNGKAYKDNFISKKSQGIADQIAQKKGLTRASVVQQKNQELTKGIKAEIHLKHKAVLKQLPKDFKAYSELMKASGVQIVPSVNKAGKTQGFRLESKGFNLKASEVHRSMSLSKITSNAVSKTISADLNPILDVGLEITKKIKRGFSQGL